MNYSKFRISYNLLYLLTSIPIHKILPEYVVVTLEEMRFVIPSKFLASALENLRHIVIDKEYFQITEAIPKPSATVLDVGAFLGFYSTICWKYMGRTGNIIAIEPIPTIYRFLRLNLKINSLEKARALPIAVAPYKGICRVYEGEYASVSSILKEHVERYTSITRVHEVRCIKLSTLIRYFKPIDLLKLDIEGLEFDVLKEASYELKNVRILVVEVHIDSTDIAELTDMLSRIGFYVVTYMPPEPREQAIVYGLNKSFNGLER